LLSRIPEEFLVFLEVLNSNSKNNVWSKLKPNAINIISGILYDKKLSNIIAKACECYVNYDYE